jgi:hypothetical protein
MATDFSSLPRYGANLRPPTPAGPAAGDWPRGAFLVSRLVAGLALAVFLVALGLPAFHENFRLYLGVECLTHPLFFPVLLLAYPAWWANPLFLAGLCALLCRQPVGAAVCGATGAALALGWWSSWDPTHSGPLLAGYWVWLASMLTLIGGAAVLWLVERRTPGAERGVGFLLV